MIFTFLFLFLEAFGKGEKKRKADSRTTHNVLRLKFKHNGFGFFVEWHINRHGLSNAKAILVEEQELFYLTYS